MRILVGYESVLGTTREVAEAIATGLRRGAPGGQVQCVQVGRLPVGAPDVDLLVLGGPTHLLGLPGDATRRMWVRGVVEASRRGDPRGHHPLEPGGVGPGLREWLADLPDVVPAGGHDVLNAAGHHLPGVWQAAAFDTRPHRPVLGTAARSIARALRQHGYVLAVPPESFFVVRPGGSLRPGEVERATAWGVDLARRATKGAPATS